MNLHLWLSCFSDCCLWARTWLTEVLHLLFKSRDLVSCSHLALLDVSLVSFQSQILWRLAVFLVQFTWPGERKCRMEPSVQRSLWSCGISSALWVAVLGVWGLARLYLCPSYLSHCGFYFLLVEDLLLVFRSFSEIDCPYIVVILVCS